MTIWKSGFDVASLTPLWVDSPWPPFGSCSTLATACFPQFQVASSCQNTRWHCNSVSWMWLWHSDDDDSLWCPTHRKYTISQWNIIKHVPMYYYDVLYPGGLRYSMLQYRFGNSSQHTPILSQLPLSISASMHHKINKFLQLHFAISVDIGLTEEFPWNWGGSRANWRPDSSVSYDPLVMRYYECIRASLFTLVHMSKNDEQGSRKTAGR